MIKHSALVDSPSKLSNTHVKVKYSACVISTTSKRQDNIGSFPVSHSIISWLTIFTVVSVSYLWNTIFELAPMQEVANANEDAEPVRRFYLQKSQRYFDDHHFPVEQRDVLIQSAERARLGRKWGSGNVKLTKGRMLVSHLPYCS